MGHHNNQFPCLSIAWHCLLTSIADKTKRLNMAQYVRCMHSAFQKEKGETFLSTTSLSMKKIKTKTCIIPQRKLKLLMTQFVESQKMNKSLFLCPYCPHCWINLKPKIKYQQRESPVHSNNCHFHAVLSPRGGNWNTNYTFMKTMILMKVTIFPLVFRYGLFRNGFHHTDEKSIFWKKALCVYFKQTQAWR